MEIQVGQVLWSMAGIRRNGKIKYPMNCEIFQCGNYPNNKCVKSGKVMGRA